MRRQTDFKADNRSIPQGRDANTGYSDHFPIQCMIKTFMIENRILKSILGGQKISSLFLCYCFDVVPSISNNRPR